MSEALKHIAAFSLLKLLGISEKSFPDSNKVEEELNVTLPVVLRNNNLDHVLQFTLSRGLSKLSNHSVDYVVTDKRCSEIAKLMGLNVLLMEDSTFFNAKTNEEVILTEESRVALFVTSLTDANYAEPLCKAIRSIGCFMTTIYCLLDYGFPIAVDNLSAYEVEIIPFLTLDAIVETAYESGHISLGQKDKLTEWQRSQVSAETNREVA